MFYVSIFRKAELVDELEAIGFHIDFIQESGGLSPMTDDDPVLIRVYARKPGISHSSGTTI